MSQKKKIRSILSVLLGLAVLVCFAFSFVVTITSLSTVTIHYYTLTRNNLSLGISPVGQNLCEIMTALFVLNVFQWSMFRYSTTSTLSRCRNSLSVSFYAQMLCRSLAHLITLPQIQQPAVFTRLLLLLAGDVELNPGPNGKEKASNQKSIDAGYNTATSVQIPSTVAEEDVLVSSSSSSTLPSEANSSAQNMDLSTSTDLSATFPPANINNSVTIHVQEPFNIATMPEASSPGMPSFPSQQAEISNGMGSIELEDPESNPTTPLPQTTTPIIQGSSIHSSTQSVDTSIISIETLTKHLEEKDRIIEEKERQIQEKDEEIRRLKEEIAQLRNKQSFISGLETILAHQSQEQPDQRLRQFLQEVQKVVKEYIDPLSGKCFEHQQAGYCSKLRELLPKLTALLSRHLWNRKTGFSSLRTRTPEQSMFLTLANQLLRFRQEFDYCPHCCCHKDDRKLDADSEHPTSHIWPSILFKEYRNIHRWETNEFILDVTDGARPKLLDPKEVSLKMLCAECERDASDWENHLSHLYVFIMSKPEKRVSRQNDNQWLNSIFATVLLRGLLVNCNFLKYIHTLGQDFFDSVYDLQQYVTEKDYKLKKKIYLFILPNCYYKDKAQENLYLLELSLRNPQFTSLIQTDKEGSFLYTQFDCFHCVYPVCPKSTEFFQKHYNSSVPPLTQSTYIVLPDSERRHLFPEILIEISLNRAKKLMEFFAMQKDKEPAALDQCTIFIKIGQAICPREEARISNYTRSSINDSKFLKFPASQGKELHQNLKKWRKDAREKSIIERIPFGKVDSTKAIGYIKLQSNMRKLKDKLEELQTKRDRFDDNMQVLKQEIIDLRAECQGDDDQQARCSEISNNLEDLEHDVQENFYGPFTGLNLSIFHSEEELNR